MAIDPAWVSVGFAGGALLFTGALAVDNWVHKQGADDTNVRRDVRQLAREVKGVRSMIRHGNKRSSEAMSKVLTKIAEIDEDVTRLKAFEEARHFHQRKDD